MTVQNQKERVSLGGTERSTTPAVLVVDLEHALLWQGPASQGNKLGMEEATAGQAPVDPQALAYNQEVLDLVRERRVSGHRTALVSASVESGVEAVAGHLAVFDEILSLPPADSDTPKRQSAGKVDLLVSRYGERGFDYVGSQPDDVAVWQKSDRAFAVSPSPQLTSFARESGLDLVALGTSSSLSILPLIRAMRPHQWVKNLLILLPVFASHEFAGLELIVIAMAAFSLTASSVYIVNDISDLDADRAHARKRNRPFASGAAKVSQGLWLAAALVAAAAGLSLAFLPSEFMAVLGLYALTTVAYTFWLKRKLLVDIITLAGLYTTRILAGGAATGISISPWLLAFSMFVFFSLAAIKRQAELVDQERNGRHSVPGRAYQSDDLAVVRGMAISSGQAAVLVLALYINSPAVIGLYTHPYVLWLLCPILFYWLSRMELLTHRGFMHDDPVVFACRDRISLLCFLSVVGVVLLAVTGY